MNDTTATGRPWPARQAAFGVGSDLWLALAALAVLLLWEASGWDLAAARLYGSAAGFPWRSDH